MLRVTKDVV